MLKSNFAMTSYIILICSFGYVATDIYLPSLPHIARYFESTEAQVQLTLFSYLISFAATPMIIGPFSDAYGRRLTILMGLAITFIATLACLFSTSMFQLIIARFLQGVGAGTVMIGGRATVPDLYEGEELAQKFTQITMLMPIILAFAPAIGGVLQELFSWHAVFIFLLVYIIAISVFAYMMDESIKETHPISTRSILNSYRDIIKNQRYIRYSFCMVIPTTALFAYLTASPFLFQEVLGLSASEYGFLTFYVGLAIMGSSHLNRRLLKRYSIDQMIWLGPIVVITSGALLLFFYLIDYVTTWTVLFPVLIMFSTLAFGFSNSVSKAMSMVKRHYGAATALVATLQFLSGSLASVCFSIIPDKSTLPLALFFLFVGLLTLLNLYKAKQYERKWIEKNS